MEITVNGRTLRLAEGDITEQAVDAVVNAANQHLQLGSGVAGAIRRKGGPTIQQECNRIGGCPVGGAVITGGGRLKARFVIHAVGPLGSDPQADDLLASATHASLRAAAENGLSSIAFPAISTGVFGFPIERCATIMLSTTIDYLAEAKEGPELAVFCLFGQAAYEVFAAELERQSGTPGRASL
jgi:O-acetyl-ADP-ribose deacetylase (regulator of RNase III)